MILVVCIVVLSPVVLGLLAAIQVYVEGVLDVNGKFNVLPLQMVVELGLVITGWLDVRVQVAVTAPHVVARSVTETVYVPKAVGVMDAVVAPLLQRYLYGGAPPDGIAVKD